MNHRIAIPFQAGSHTRCEGELIVLRQLYATAWLTRCQRCRQVIALDPPSSREFTYEQQIECRLVPETCRYCRSILSEPGASRCIKCGKHQSAKDPLTVTITLDPSDFWELACDLSQKQNLRWCTGEEALEALLATFRTIFGEVQEQIADAIIRDASLTYEPCLLYHEELRRICDYLPIEPEKESETPCNTEN